MKIRCSFVTNSSSGSFVTLTVRSRELEKFLEQFGKDVAKDLYYSVDGIRVQLSDEDMSSYKWERFSDSVPENRQEILGLLSYFLEELGDENEDGSTFISDMIWANSSRLTDSIDYCSGVAGWEGGGGDDYLRFGYDYPPEMKRQMLEKIAEQKKYRTSDEVTEEDWEDYLRDKLLTTTRFYTYDRQKGIEEKGNKISLGDHSFLKDLKQNRIVPKDEGGDNGTIRISVRGQNLSDIVDKRLLLLGKQAETDGIFDIPKWDCDESCDLFTKNYSFGEIRLTDRMMEEFVIDLKKISNDVGFNVIFNGNRYSSAVGQLGYRKEPCGTKWEEPGKKT